MNKLEMVEILALTAELCGSRRLSDGALLMLVDDLIAAGVDDGEIFAKAAAAMRAEFSGNLTQKIILEYYRRAQAASTLKLSGPELPRTQSAAGLRKIAEITAFLKGKTNGKSKTCN